MTLYFKLYYQNMANCHLFFFKCPEFLKCIAFKYRTAMCLEIKTNKQQ